MLHSKLKTWPDPSIEKHEFDLGFRHDLANYFIPIQRPNLFRRPFLVSGIPVDFEIERFALVTPNARFHEKVSPGPNFI